MSEIPLLIQCERVKLKVYQKGIENRPEQQGHIQDIAGLKCDYEQEDMFAGICISSSIFEDICILYHRGIVYPKIKIVTSFTHPHEQFSISNLLIYIHTCMYTATKVSKKAVQSSSLLSKRQLKGLMSLMSKANVCCVILPTNEI